jgi:hypothetical protein
MTEMNGEDINETKQSGMITMLITPERNVQFQITDGENILHTMVFTPEEATSLSFAILRGLQQPAHKFDA